MVGRPKNITVASKITSKNQVTIPKIIREALNVKASDEIEWELADDGQIVVSKKSPDSSAFWLVVNEQEKKYGSVNGPEVDWDSDVGSENFD